jgi:hypothetical protein
MRISRKFVIALALPIALTACNKAEAPATEDTVVESETTGPEAAPATDTTAPAAATAAPEADAKAAGDEDAAMMPDEGDGKQGGSDKVKPATTP